MKFRKGDAVYESKDHIGILTSVPSDDGRGGYRVDYCQGRDLETGPRGGNGPIFAKGYPQPVTDPDGVLFVAGLKLRREIAAMKKSLKQAELELKSIKIARDVLGGNPNDE